LFIYDDKSAIDRIALIIQGTCREIALSILQSTEAERVMYKSHQNIIVQLKTD